MEIGSKTLLAALICIAATLPACVSESETREDDSKTVLERLQTMYDAENWSGLASAKVRCGRKSEACAEAHALKADACLHLVVLQAPSRDTSEARTEQLLECAENGYKRALDLTPARAGTPAITSYYDSLLLTLSERRNRTPRDKPRKLARHNDNLLTQSNFARSRAPRSAFGYVYGGSALLFRAHQGNPNKPRCADLKRGEALLKRSPAPPAQLENELKRLKRLTSQAMRRGRCH